LEDLFISCLRQTYFAEQQIARAHGKQDPPREDGKPDNLGPSSISKVFRFALGIATWIVPRKGPAEAGPKDSDMTPREPLQENRFKRTASREPLQENRFKRTASLDSYQMPKPDDGSLRRLSDTQ
jgi:hypothetical protein